MTWKYAETKVLMKKRGRRTDWVADECGIEVTTLRNMLRGSKPSLPVMKLMAIALQCDLSEIFDSTETVGQLEI